MAPISTKINAMTTKINSIHVTAHPTPGTPAAVVTTEPRSKKTAPEAM